MHVQARARYADGTRARTIMLEATHTKAAPWMLVDFNDQRRGRLKLIRRLLDAILEHAVPEAAIDLPPQGHELLAENSRGR